MARRAPPGPMRQMRSRVLKDMRATSATFLAALLLPGAQSASAQVGMSASDPLAPLAESAATSPDSVKVIRDWVVASRDNGPLPYMVIDKITAEAFVFNAGGEEIGRTPVLIGSAEGDDSAPGIGERELRAIPPSERTTPAGRFVAKFGPAAGHKKVIWVDWSTAVSMHPVVTANRKEHRLERLASSTSADNRITYGCINVPAKFYEAVVAPLLTETPAVVYILPEKRSLQEVFWPAAEPAAQESAR